MTCIHRTSGAPWADSRRAFHESVTCLEICVAAWYADCCIPDQHTIVNVVRRDAELNRRRIIETARMVFRRHGLKVGLNDIAQSAGIGVGTVYRRFNSKDALIEAVFADALTELATMAAEMQHHADPWCGFTCFVERMCELTADDRGLREIAFDMSFGGDEIETASEHLAESVSVLIRRAQISGQLRQEIAETDVLVVGLLAGIVSNFAGGVRSDLWRRYVAIVLEGMRNRHQSEIQVKAPERQRLRDRSHVSH